MFVLFQFEIGPLTNLFADQKPAAGAGIHSKSFEVLIENHTNV